MQIPKERILDFLRERGESEKAARAEQELPERVDTERHSEKLQELGIDVNDLASKLPEGLGDKLGL